MLALQPGTLQQKYTATDRCHCWIVVSLIMFMPLHLLTCSGKLSIRSDKATILALELEIVKIEAAQKIYMRD